MIEIGGAKLRRLPVDGLELVRHLEYFDGPLLSQFRHRRQGDNYLYYWCECDEKVNRWMVLRVSETNIIRLVNRFVPLDFVVPKACQDDFVYFVDRSGDGGASVRLVALDSIPEEYVPDRGAYLEATEQDFSTFPVLIEQNLSIKELSAFPRDFQMVYAFVYSLFTKRPERLDPHPWRGGFSSMHFSNWLLARIPSEHRPYVSTLQYASPGFIRFSHLDSTVAHRVCAMIAKIEGPHPDLTESVSLLTEYIKANKLNAIEYPGDTRWTAHNSDLKRLTLDLLVAIQIPEPSEIMRSAQRPFEAAKVALSFARRLVRLARWEQEGLVKFPLS